MDAITLRNLRFRSLHGFHPEERERGNDFEVDVTLRLSLSDAARGDDLEQTVDYSRVAALVGEVMEGRSVKLIETLLYDIGESLTRAFPNARKIKVAVRKLNPPMSPSCEYTEVRSQWPKL
ncbi:MAG: dihydroneopterin aldolase [Cyclonatronaceae bacterium]